PSRRSNPCKPTSEESNGGLGHVPATLTKGLFSPFVRRDRRGRLLRSNPIAGRVAEWQTRWLQVPVRATSWGFKSPLAHGKGAGQRLFPDRQKDHFFRTSTGASGSIRMGTEHSLCRNPPHRRVSAQLPRRCV